MAQNIREFLFNLDVNSFLKTWPQPYRIIWHGPLCQFCERVVESSKGTFILNRLDLGIFSANFGATPCSVFTRSFEKLFHFWGILSLRSFRFAFLRNLHLEKGQMLRFPAI